MLRRCRDDNLIPAELAGVIHVGPSLDVAFVRVVDGGGAGVGSAQDEDEAVQADGRGVFVIYRSEMKRKTEGDVKERTEPTGISTLDNQISFSHKQSSAAAESV